MDTVETPQSSTESPHGLQSIRCSACEAALNSPNREGLSFLLLDQFTIPLVGCEDHLEQFSTLCGLATDDTPDLLHHHPAGGLQCPGCRHAPHETEQRVVPVGNGGLAILACAAHESDILTQFRTGLEIQQQLTASLDGPHTQS
jgi:hypothetical protein